MLAKTIVFGLLFAFLPAALAFDGAPRYDSWEVIGPGGGGGIFLPTISPHDANLVLVSCDMTGSYISHDGGRSWRMFNLRGPVRFFAFDPINARTIYAGTEALWRSVDDGATWNLVWPRPSTVRGVRMSSDHADETIISDHDPVGQIVALAIDPASSHVLFAAGVTGNKAAVFISKDAG